MRNPPVRRTTGFTLIEVLIAVAVVTLLVAVALPSYRDSVVRSQRLEARTALTEAAQWAERFRSENAGSYVGLTVPAGLAAVPPPPAAARYTVAVSNVTATTYTLTAAPVAGGALANDACGSFTLDQTGRRTAATLASGAVYDRCWSR